VGGQSVAVAEVEIVNVKSAKKRTGKELDESWRLIERGFHWDFLRSM
jgi:hypothetical protein